MGKTGGPISHEALGGAKDEAEEKDEGNDEKRHTGLSKNVRDVDLTNAFATLLVLW